VPLKTAASRLWQRCTARLWAGVSNWRLGCDARVAAAGTVVGLPEVTLGIIPGAGGTQRLPRIVGIPRAIAMICSGERVGSAAALAAGLIDAEAQGELRAAAVAHARQLAGRKQRLRDRAAPAADAAAIAVKQRAAALKAGKRRPQVQAAIDAIVATATVAFDDGLADERAVFQRLRVSREAFALRHQFFAERDSTKHPSLVEAQPRDMACIAVIGAGTMGSGIAIAALDAGYQVLLLEQEAGLRWSGAQTASATTTPAGSRAAR
jgi:3-hydroxyacyl-CoA dehydrogenase